MKRRQLLTAVPAAAILTGCGLKGILPVIGGVITTITRAIEVLDEIDRVTKIWFADSTDRDKQEKLAAAMGVARNALTATLKLTQGAEKASKDEVNTAFALFLEAYEDVLSVLTSLGFGLKAGNVMMAPSRWTKPTINVVAPDVLKQEMAQ